MEAMGITGQFIAIALCATTLFAGELSHSKNVQGFSYRHDEIAEGPWSIHIVKMDRSNTNLELQTTLPPGRRFGLARLSAQVKGLNVGKGHVVAAINGDYYENHQPYVGDPQGLQIMRGELISAPFDWTCFWIDPRGQPNMGIVEAKFQATLPCGALVNFGLNEARENDEAVIYTSAVGSKTKARGGVELILEPWSAGPQLPLRAGEKYFAKVVEINKSGNSATTPDRLVLSLGPKLLKEIPPPAIGDMIRISTATSPSLKNVQTAIGGGPAILRAGKRVFPKQAHVRHPRSVVGWNRQSIFLVEVDGRQRNLSVGMTFEELADYLMKIGCDNAMSLDGGGSSTLWALGQVMNNPCEGAERGAANGLAIVAKEMR
jgi:hypothetical protein